MNCYDGANNLARELSESEECREYKRLKEIVMEDEVNRALLKEYKALQSRLQLSAMAGSAGAQEDMQRFSQLSSLLYTQKDISAYLMSEMKLQQLVADIIKLITDASGLQISLPGQET
ncbi:MAG: YlbF family regulator [Eubacteriales bacterium]|nr:YlbF family regulator [Eubacteriales bacterium]MDD3882215.1 YlbF family regulator [Eubacteriales bacterium]MDD4512564.1 YlbF family regulator [Eubacteriales bacterium]